jgi:hypothetical protein
VIRRVAEEDAGNGPSFELVASSSRDVRVAQAPKDTQLGVVGGDTEQELMQSARRRGAERPAVEVVGGGVHGLSPESRWHGRMAEERSDPVVERAKDAFGLPILLTRVRTGEAEMSAMVGKQGAHGSAVELAPVVCLKRKDGKLKLGLNICGEISKNRESFRLVFQRKRPDVMTEIIEHNQVKLIA